MDFKPFSEVVLPPEKGTGIDPKSGRREKKGPGAPKIREYQLGPDSILVLDESLARGPEMPEPSTVVTAGAGGPAAAGAGPVLTADDLRHGEERLFSVPQRPSSVTLKPAAAEASRQAPAPAPARPAPAAAIPERPPAPRPPAVKPPAPRPPASAPAASASAPASRKKINPNLNRDFIIAYNRSFIGCFRASKRITNRTAFLQVAQTVQGKIEDFDISKLELYKAVPLKVKKPRSLSDVTSGSVNWFPEKEGKRGEPKV